MKGKGRKRNKKRDEKEKEERGTHNQFANAHPILSTLATPQQCRWLYLNASARVLCGFSWRVWRLQRRFGRQDAVTPRLQQRRRSRSRSSLWWRSGASRPANQSAFQSSSQYASLSSTVDGIWLGHANRVPRRPSRLRCVTVRLSRPPASFHGLTSLLINRKINIHELQALYLVVWITI